jgi:hypothetical protein
MADTNAFADVLRKFRCGDSSRQSQHHTLPLAAEQRRLAVGTLHERADLGD